MTKRKNISKNALNRAILACLFKNKRLTTSINLINTIWCRQGELNSRPTDYESVALPSELCRQYHNFTLDNSKNQ